MHTKSAYGEIQHLTDPLCLVMVASYEWQSLWREGCWSTCSPTWATAAPCIAKWLGKYKPDMEKSIPVINFADTTLLSRYANSCVSEAFHLLCMHFLCYLCSHHWCWKLTIWSLFLKPGVFHFLLHSLFNMGLLCLCCASSVCINVTEA